jgi:hypothetical protein
MDNKEFRLCKRHYNQLGKLLLAEATGSLPLQAKNKTMDELVENGYARKSSVTMTCNDGFAPMVIHGYELTLQGNMAYCMSPECS